LENLQNFIGLDRMIWDYKKKYRINLKKFFLFN